MKNKVSFILLIVALFILQTSCLAIILPFPFTPDLFLIIAISVALLFNFSFALTFAAVSGLIFDFLSFQKLGITSIILVLAVYSVSFLTRRFSIENKTEGSLSLIMLMAIITFLYRFAITTISFHFENILLPLKDIFFFSNIWKEIILNIIFFIPIFYLLKKIKFKNTNTLYNLAKIK